MNNAPLGIFDSGVGGLSCIGPIIRKMPAESIVFYGDCLRAPYGDRPVSEIIRFSLQIADHLAGEGCKALVIACNTISCLAIDAIREAHPDMPVIGIIEPAARAIADAGLTEIVAASTEATARSGAYATAVAKLCDCKVFAQGCPQFVPIIEGGKTGTPEAEAAVRFHLDRWMRQTGNIVLGCTHYPFIRADIERVYPGVRIIDPAEALAEEVEAQLRAAGLLAEGNASYRIAASRVTDTMRLIAGKVLQEKEYTLFEHVLSESGAVNVLRKNDMG